MLRFSRIFSKYLIFISSFVPNDLLQRAEFDFPILIARDRIDHVYPESRIMKIGLAADKGNDLPGQAFIRSKDAHPPVITQTDELRVRILSL